MLRRLVLAQAAMAAPVDNTVVSLKQPGAIAEALRGDGVDVQVMDMRGVYDFPSTVVRLHHTLRHLDPDVVQTWMAHADLVGGLAARWAGVPVVAWGVRTTDYSVESRATRLVRWVCARLSRRVPDAIVCAAEASRLEHLRAGYDSTRMLVIPNGFDVDALAARRGRGRTTRKEHGLGSHSTVVGFCGRYNPAKDVGNFVAAAARLAARHADVRFLMIGRGVERSNDELASLIDATGYKDRFILLGERPDVPDCLDALDVFVQSSCTEGFPNVVGEAMAMGVPCVVTNVGDARMLVGETGRVVPPRDPASLAAAVDALLSLPDDERYALGARAHARIRDEFSIERACERFTRLHADLLERASPRRTERPRCAG